MIDNKKLIEIRKAGFINKGAELMLHATLEQIYKHYPEAKLAMETAYGPAPYERRARLGFYQKAQFWKYGIQFGSAFNFVPKIVRRTLGIVLDKELDIVFDAAGFAYGDQWGADKTLALANSCKRWKKHGVKCVLLPQAFGPFTSKKIIKAINDVADNASLIIAREQKSYDYLVGAVGKRDNIKLYPDFTNLVKGRLPASFQPEMHQICIVPNKQMVKMANMNFADYIRYLVKIVNFFVEKNEKPFFLVHELGEDKKIVDAVQKQLETPIPVMAENDPIAIKGIIGASKATVGSRFHGLVGALSQGVPSVAMGWSHKYSELFTDYDCIEGVVPLDASDEVLFKSLNSLIDSQSREATIKKLEANSEKLKQLSEQMWSDVFASLES